VQCDKLCNKSFISAVNDIKTSEVHKSAKVTSPQLLVIHIPNLSEILGNYEKQLKVHCVLLQVPVKVRLVGGSAWNQGPCMVSKFGLPVSDTVYYYRHIFTVIGSLIVIFLVTFYGNIFMHLLVLRSFICSYGKIALKWMLREIGCENVNCIEIVCSLSGSESFNIFQVQDSLPQLH